MAPIDLGLGFILPTTQPNGLTMPYGYGPHASARSFGHSGNQSSCAFADPDARVSGAYVMTRQSPHLIGDPRAVRLVEALYAGL